MPSTSSDDVSRRSSIASRPPMPPTTPPAIAPAAAPTSTHQMTLPRSSAKVSERLARVTTSTRSQSAAEFGRELSGLGRRRTHTDAARLERLLLPLGRSRGAGDDRPRMPHRLARWRREAGDIGNDGLRHLRLDEVRGLLLLVAADLADHDDVLRLGVGLE